MLGAAISCGEYAFAGSSAGFVGDDISHLVKLDEVFKSLVVGQLTYADKCSFAIYVDRFVRFGVLKAQGFKLVIGNKFLEGEVILNGHVLARV